MGVNAGSDGVVDVLLSCEATNFDTRALHGSQSYAGVRGGQAPVVFVDRA